MFIRRGYVDSCRVGGFIGYFGSLGLVLEMGFEHLFYFDWGLVVAVMCLEVYGFVFMFFVGLGFLDLTEVLMCDWFVKLSFTIYFGW